MELKVRCPKCSSLQLEMEDDMSLSCQVCGQNFRIEVHCQQRMNRSWCVAAENIREFYPLDTGRLPQAK